MHSSIKAATILFFILSFQVSQAVILSPSDTLKITMLGCGYEMLCRNNAVLTAPEIFITVKPIKDLTAVKISFKNRKGENNSSPGVWSGNVWFEL